MNKKTKTAVQPLSDNTRRIIIITAIIVVAIVVLSVALALILKPEQNTPSGNDSNSNGSSSLTIRNGDFNFATSEETAYPKAAQNWSKYGYKTPVYQDTDDPSSEITSHGLESITTNETAVMGIVTTATEGDGDTWDTVTGDLQAENITNVTNPGKPDVDAEDDNVYMIAAKEATTATILSDSFSISSGKSAKITVSINTEQLTDGYAVIMVQSNNTSAMSKYWYAYNSKVEKQDGWQEFSFYIFNREASSKSIRICIGLGNVYSGEREEGFELVAEEGETTATQPQKAQGVLFVDEVRYEEVTANEYRTVVDGNDVPEHSFKVLENEDIDVESIYLGWDQQNGQGDVSTLDTSEDVATAMGGYSPFTNRDDFLKDEETDGDRVPTGFKVYKLAYDGSNIENGLVGFRLNVSDSDIDANVKGANGGIKTLYSLWQKDHHHISFWVRADRQDNEASLVNIYVQTRGESDWEDLSNGSWTAVKTSQEIDTDSNCGWVKYDIYLKPAAIEREVSVLVCFGNKDPYSEEEKENELTPSGTLYLTAPAYERISAKDYSNAASGSNAKKLDMITVSANTVGVTNGSFSSLNNTSKQPSSWTGAFAGDSMLYRDGRDNEEIAGINRQYNDVYGSGVERNSSNRVTAQIGGEQQTLDDEQNNVLLVKNNVATSFGYYSADITLSARNVYLLSVYVKAEATAKPHFYLMNTDTSLERADRIVAEGKVFTENERALGQGYANSELQNGWQRWYIVVVTGNSSQTVRFALFNGSIDGTEKGTGSAYFDMAQMISLGTYATATDTENEDAEKYIVNWTMGNYELDDEAITIKDFLTQEQVELLVSVGALKLEENETAENGAFSTLTIMDIDSDAWNEMLTIPEAEENEPTDSETTATESTPVDLGLLFSVISSVALVAALLVVIVVKLYKTRKNQRSA